MKISAWCKTDKGLRRESNQDSFLVNHDLGLYIVADGMGGHSGGEVASAMAVAAVETYFKETADSGLSARDRLSHAYTKASNAIFDKSAQEPGLAGMGTTMVLCFFDGTSFFVANVGDSRAYLFHKPNLWQITEDHSLVNEHLRAGIISEEQVQTFTGKNVITRSVGYEREVVVDVVERPAVSGDRILLCSDGLTGMVPDILISEILNNTDNSKVVDSCVERALANGGTDNVTVLYLHVI